MSNPHCECPAAGWCARHKMQKSAVLHSLCSGTNDLSSTCGRDVFIAMEKGRLGATAPDNPVINPPAFCGGIKRNAAPVSSFVPEKKRNSAKAGISGGCGCGKKKK